MYSLYLSNLRMTQLSARHFTFADDTVLLHRGENINTLVTTNNPDVNKYYECLLGINKDELIVRI